MQSLLSSETYAEFKLLISVQAKVGLNSLYMQMISGRRQPSDVNDATAHSYKFMAEDVGYESQNTVSGLSVIQSMLITYLLVATLTLLSCRHTDVSTQEKKMRTRYKEPCHRRLPAFCLH